MGAYLSQPITDKESTDGEDGRFKYGTTAMQGWRTNMEVRHGRSRRDAWRRDTTDNCQTDKFDSRGNEKK
jgi:hypothetical protein